MSQRKQYIRRVTEEPQQGEWQPDSMYLIRQIGTSTVKVVVTDLNSIPYEIDSEGIRHKIEYNGELIESRDTLNFTGSVEVLNENGKTKINIKSNHRARFDYHTGDSQVFDTGQRGIKVMSVLVNGVGLDISQYNDDTDEFTADGTIEILDELSNADYIDIYYEK